MKRYKPFFENKKNIIDFLLELEKECSYSEWKNYTAFVFNNFGIEITFQKFKDGLFVSNFEAKKTGQGNGSKFLDYVISLSDKFGINLYTYPDAYNNKYLSTEQLRDFYIRHGFNKPYKFKAPNGKLHTNYLKHTGKL
jgi:hypothetical protein